MAATHNENELEATVIQLQHMRSKGLNESIEQDQEMKEVPKSQMKGRVNQHQQENLNMTDHEENLTTINETCNEAIDEKQDKANIATYLPDSYESDQDKTRKCSCNCTPCSCNCPTCCSCFDKCKIFPDKESIKKASQVGTFTLMKYIFSNLIYPVTREVIVYGGLIATLFFFVLNLVLAIYQASRRC